MAGILGALLQRKWNRADAEEERLRLEQQQRDLYAPYSVDDPAFGSDSRFNMSHGPSGAALAMPMPRAPEGGPADLYQYSGKPAQMQVPADPNQLPRMDRLARYLPPEQFQALAQGVTREGIASQDRRYGTDVDADTKAYVARLQEAGKTGRWSAEGGGPGARPLDVIKIGTAREQQATWGARRRKAGAEENMAGRADEGDRRARNVFEATFGTPPELSPFVKEQATATTKVAEAAAAPDYYTNRAQLQKDYGTSALALAGNRDAKTETENMLRDPRNRRAESEAERAAREAGEVIDARLANYDEQLRGRQEDTRAKAAVGDLRVELADQAKTYGRPERDAKVKRLEAQLREATSSADREELQAKLDDLYSEKEREEGFQRIQATSKTAQAQQRTAESGARVAEGTEESRIAQQQSEQRRKASRALYQETLTQLEQQYGSLDREAALELAAQRTELAMTRVALAEKQVETEKLRGGLITEQTQALIEKGGAEARKYEEEIKRKAAEARLAEITLEMKQAGVPDAERRAKALADKEVAAAEKAGIDVMTAKERVRQGKALADSAVAEAQYADPLAKARAAEAQSRAEKAATYALSAQEEAGWKRAMAPVNAWKAYLDAQKVVEDINRTKALTGQAVQAEQTSAAVQRLREADLQRRQTMLPLEERLTEAQIKQVLSKIESGNPNQKALYADLLRAAYPASGRSGSRKARKELQELISEGTYDGNFVGFPMGPAGNVSAPQEGAEDLFYGGR